MIAHKAPRIEPPSTGSFGGDSTQDWELANAAISFGQTLLSLSLPLSLFPSPRSAAMMVSLLLYLFPLLHLGYALVANPSASRSSSSSSHPSLGVPKSSAHCSDCERLLSSRIKEKQEVERVKHRIMVAIRSTNSDFAMPSSRFGATVTAAAFAETSPPRGVFSDGDDSGGKESGEKAAAVERRRQAGGRPRKERKKYTTVKRNREMTGLASYDQDDDDVDGGGDDDNDDDDDGASSREWSVKKNVGGPDIVTFSKVLISRRRRNVLQFKLSSVEPEVQNLEVVKARLWLLLHGKSPSSSSEEPNTASKFKDTEADRSTANSWKLGMVLVGSGQMNTTDTQPDTRVVPRADDDRPAASKQKKKTAVFKVLLLNDNGTETLLTYLRTNVTVTNWHKLNLPVGMIQQQLHAAQPFLTLVIRCSRCGRALQTSPPTAGTTKPVAGDRRRRKEGGAYKARSRRQRSRVHGDGKASGRQVTGQRKMASRMPKRLQHLPFLVINTRIRKS